LQHWPVAVQSWQVDPHWVLLLATQFPAQQAWMKEEHTVDPQQLLPAKRHTDVPPQLVQVPVDGQGVVPQHVDPHP
jgi:hypothetical protein